MNFMKNNTQDQSQSPTWFPKRCGTGLDVDTLRGHTKNAVVYTGGNVNLHQPPWVPRHHPLLLRSPPTYTNSPSRFNSLNILL